MCAHFQVLNREAQIFAHFPISIIRSNFAPFETAGIGKQKKSAERIVNSALGAGSWSNFSFRRILLKSRTVSAPKAVGIYFPLEFLRYHPAYVVLCSSFGRICIESKPVQ
jgi:hypothetical protein